MFKKDQRVKLNIIGMELPGRVTEITPTKDKKSHWITIKFLDGPIGCYHSKNVIDDVERQQNAKTWNMLEL